MTNILLLQNLVQADLIRKPEFDFKLKGISDTVNKNKTKHLLVENETKI